MKKNKKKSKELWATAARPLLKSIPAEITYIDSKWTICLDELVPLCTVRPILLSYNIFYNFHVKIINIYIEKHYYYFAHQNVSFCNQ